MAKKKFLIHAWIIWLLSALFMFYKYAIEVSPSVMAPTLMKTFSIDGVQLGNLAACYFYAYLILQIPAGVLLDRIGPRKVTTLAMLICACGCLLFGAAEHLFLAGLGRFLTGVGAAFAAVNCLKLTANWFPARQFAFMAGLMMTIAMLGAVGGQAPLAAFIQAVDWRVAMQIIGVAGFILAALFWLIVRDMAPNKKQEVHIAPQRLSLSKSLKTILKNAQAWWISIYSGFAFAPIMIFGGLWGVSFISESSCVTLGSAANLVSLIFIGFAVGAPLFGYLSDRIGKRVIVMFWGTFIALFCISAAVYIPCLSTLTMGTLLFLFGFSISSFLLCFTMIREIHLPILAATAVGFMNAFDAFFGAFSDPMTGKILDLFWDGKIVDGARVFSVDAYRIAFLTLPAYLLVSLLTLIKVKETHCKQYNPVALP
ncbi:MAG: hypothetical protein RLZZ453_601 [Chlamydiota bacterium]|jgi:MFS family permease